MQDGARQDDRETVPVQVRLANPLFTEIENWRRRERDIPTRPEAVRRLVARARYTFAGNRSRMSADVSTRRHDWVTSRSRALK